MSDTAKRQLSVRLTVFLASVLAVSLLIGGVAGADGSPPPTSEYVVVAGDTLWEVAASLAGPEDDVRNLIADIKAVSGITSSTIYPGQILLIPEV